MNKQIISSTYNPFNLRIKEVIRFRELLWTLASRDLKVKYAQSIIGFGWALINPLVQIFVLSFVFGTIANVGTGDANMPHLIFTSAGMLGWTFFSQIFNSASNSIISAQNIVQKIYFPRIILPLSKSITAFVDFFIMFLVVLGLFIALGVKPNISLPYFIFFLTAVIISGLAGGIWIAALTIRFRDFIHIIPLLLRLGMYASPIAYPSSAVPEQYKFIFYLNPMAGVIEGIRWSLIGGTFPHQYAFFSVAGIFILFISGLFYFNSIERKIADII